MTADRQPGGDRFESTLRDILRAQADVRLPEHLAVGLDEILRTTPTAPQRRWRLANATGLWWATFGATRFVVAAVIVALFGGFLLASVLTQPNEGSAPGVGTIEQEQSTAVEPDDTSTSLDLLPGVDLVTEEAEPGVYRVLSDGLRNVEWGLDEALTQPQQPAVVATDDGLWLAVTGAGLRLGDPGAFEVEWETDRPGAVDVTGPSSVRLVPEEDGEIVWALARGDRTLHRYSPAGREVFTADDDTPVFTGLAPVIGLRTAVAPDGAGWFSLYDSFGRNPIPSSDCGGLVRYDGRTSTYFLQDRGFCVSGLDVDVRGHVWVLGWNHVLEDPDESRWNEGPVGLYVVIPEEVGSDELVGIEPAPSGESVASVAPVITLGLLPDADLVAEEAEPGVYRVIAVIADATEHPLPKVDQLVTAPDGTVWVVAGPNFGRMGGHDMLDGPELPGGEEDLDWHLVVGGDRTPVAYQPGGAGRITRFADAGWQSYPTDGWNAVLAATTTTTGDLWASVNAGDDELAVGRFDGDRWTWYDRADLGVREGWVRDFAETPDGSIWAGADNGGGPTQGGLTHFDGREWHPVDPFSTDGRFAASDLEVAPDGTLWAGMLRGGRESYLGHWDGSEWTVRPRDGAWGLPTGSSNDGSDAWPAVVVHPNDLGLGEPTGIERTPDGRVWVPMSSGDLYIITPEAVAAAEDSSERLYKVDESGTILDRQQKENGMDQRMSPRATAVAALSLATALAAASTPAATAQDLQPTMSEFSGRLGCGTAGPSSEAVSWRFPVVEISDERFDGTYVNQLTGYEDGDPDVDGIGAYSALWEITNEEGGWVGQTATFRFPPGSYSTTSVALEGQGAYAGLTAIMEGDFTEDCGFDIRGVVVDGELPATPVAVMAAE